MDEKKEAQGSQEAPKGQQPKEAASPDPTPAPGVSKSANEEGGEDQGRASPLEEARALDKSIAKHKEDITKLVDRHEKILADARLEGRSFAGQASAGRKEETPAEYTKRVQAGDLN